MTYTSMFVFLAMGVANGSGVVISQYFGAKRFGEMRRTASTIMIMLIALGAFFTVFCIVTARPASRYLLKIEDAEILSYSVTYIAIYSAGLIFQFIYNAVAGILRSVGDSKAIASVFGAMCARLELGCITVTGTYQGQPRSWNILQIDGAYFHTDLLRSLAEGRLRTMTDSQMTGYVWDYSAYPACPDPVPLQNDPPQPPASEPEETVPPTEPPASEPAENPEN